jgi:sugar transferase (PEP-CTERM system associated)
MSLRARGIGVLSEGVLVFLSFVGAVLIRLGGDLRGTVEHPNLIAKGLLCVAAVALSLYYGDLYDYPARRRTELFLRLGQCMALAAVALAVLFFLVPGLRVGRSIFTLFLLLAWSALLVWRLVVLWSWGNLAGIGDRVLILGTGVFAQNVAREMLKRSPVGYRVLGFLTEHSVEVGRVLVNPSVVGTLADLPSLADSLGATLIVVAQEDRRKRLPVEALLRCRLAGVSVVEAANLLETLSGRIPLRDLRPSWLIFSAGFQKHRILGSMKRVGEALAAGAMLVLAAPIMAAVAVLVRLSSPGPALYRQTRVGRNGRLFDLLKFRSMTDDAEADSGPVWAAPGEDDPRVTPVGRFLRKTRLDELPQLWNVAKGDMSFVGPRPERPHFVEKLRKVIPYYDERHGVRPGITGWAQVKYPYASTLEDAEEKLEYDLYYVKHMSLLLDVAIVLETFKVILLGRGR